MRECVAQEVTQAPAELPEHPVDSLVLLML